METERYMMLILEKKGIALEEDNASSQDSGLTLPNNFMNGDYAPNKFKMTLSRFLILLVMRKKMLPVVFQRICPTQPNMVVKGFLMVPPKNLTPYTRSLL